MYSIVCQIKKKFTCTGNFWTLTDVPKMPSSGQSRNSNYFL